MSATPATTGQSQISRQSLRYSRSWPSLACGHTCTVHPTSVRINPLIDRVTPRRLLHSKSRMISTLTWTTSRAVCCCLLTSMLDIDTLLSRLHLDFGITGVASAWLRSYLTDRLCYVAVGNSRSDTWICHEGVPQGSVLGPLLFSSYESPIARIFDRFDIGYHQYADDTQLYTAARSSEDTSTLLMCVEE